MGWTISHHTGSPLGVLMPSYTAVEELASQLAHVTRSADWRVLRPVLRPTNNNPHEFRPEEAAAVAEVLVRAVRHPLMPGHLGAFALRIAETARNAADCREPWSWR